MNLYSVGIGISTVLEDGFRGYRYDALPGNHSVFQTICPQFLRTKPPLSIIELVVELETHRRPIAAIMEGQLIVGERIMRPEVGDVFPLSYHKKNYENSQVVSVYRVPVDDGKTTEFEERFDSLARQIIP